jgi:Fur family transcriptional regulator, ferric uptake regulator
MKTVRLQRRSLMQELVAQGVRITAQRKVLIETIQQAEGHIDAPTLLAMARQRDTSIDRATVYRTLDLLKKRGLIDELDLMHLTGEKHFYEVKTHKDHVHLACFECGKIEEFTNPFFERLKGEIGRQRGFQIQVIRLEVGGLCQSCVKTQAKTTPQNDRRPTD